MSRLIGRATRPKRVKLEVWDSCVTSTTPSTFAKVEHAGEELTITMDWKPWEACLEGHARFNDDSFVKVVVRLMEDARILGRVWANATTARQWQFNVEMPMEERK